MTADPCKRQLGEYVEAMLKYYAARQRTSAFLLPATEPLDSQQDIDPVILTEEMLVQWREADMQEEEAKHEFGAKTDALWDCRRAVKSHH